MCTHKFSDANLFNLSYFLFFNEFATVLELILALSELPNGNFQKDMKNILKINQKSSKIDAKLWVAAAYSTTMGNLHPQIWIPNAGPGQECEPKWRRLMWFFEKYWFLTKIKNSKFMTYNV